MMNERRRDSEILASNERNEPDESLPCECYLLMPLPPQSPQGLEDIEPRPPIPTVPVPWQLLHAFFEATAASWRFWSSDLNISSRSTRMLVR